jgi:hypothetical protein
MSLPRSLLFTVNNLFEKEPAMYLQLKHKERVFVADDELTERRMAVIAAELGFNQIKILEGGLDGFKKQILNFTPIANPKTIEQIDTNRFRSKASQILPVMIENNKPRGPVQKKLKRVIGGC